MKQFPSKDTGLFQTNNYFNINNIAYLSLYALLFKFYSMYMMLTTNKDWLTDD